MDVWTITHQGDTRARWTGRAPAGEAWEHLIACLARKNPGLGPGTTTVSVVGSIAVTLVNVGDHPADEVGDALRQLVKLHQAGLVDTVRPAARSTGGRRAGATYKDVEATRQRIRDLLAADPGVTDVQLCREVGVAARTAARWRAEFADLPHEN